MISRAREGRRLGLVGQWLLALVVVGSALAIGTVHTVTLCVVTLLLGISTALLLVNRRPYPRRRAATILLVLGAGLTAFTALQCIPLPAGWVATLAPHNADIWSRALLPLGESGPSWVPISVDPVATRVQVVRGIAYMLAFIAALEIARSKRGIRFLTYVLVASGVTVMVVALLHPAFDQTRVFGLYTPRGDTTARHIAPILNANHLSAYLNIALCCALVAALDANLGRARILPATLVVMLVGGQLWIASRGGVVSMVLGACLVVSLRAFRSRRIGTTPIVATLVAAGGVAMAVFGQWDEAWLELADTDASKLRFFAEVLPMVRTYPLWGAGRGAFESSFPEFRTGLGYLLFTKPENVLLQWGTEWGIPVAVVGLGAVVWALRPSIAIARGKGALGAWAALVAVGLHNFVDYSAETPAVMFALCCCAAVVVGGNSVESGAPRITNPHRLVAAISATCVGLLLGLSTLGKDLESDRASLTERSGEGPQFDRIVRIAMLRHPAEPYLPYIGAVHAMKSGSSVILWVERTLERAPVYGPAHLLLARELGRSHPAQARLEDNLGMEQMDVAGTTQDVVQAAVSARLVGSFDDALELAPKGRQRTVALSILSQRLAERLPATSYRLDDLLLEVPPPPSFVLHHRAEESLVDLRAREASPWCDADRLACVAFALQAVQRFEAAEPTCEAHALEATVRIEGGAREDAFLHLKTYADSVPQAGPCLVQVAEVALAAGLPDEATRAVDQLVHAPCTTQDECVANLTWAAAIENGRGNTRRSLALYQKALDIAPERDDVAVLVAEESFAQGMYSEAIVAYQRLTARHPDDTKYRDGLNRANAGLARHLDLNSAPR